MTAERTDILFNWSSGKDSALALHRLLQNDDCHVTQLLTTVSEKYRRVSQHGVRVELLEKQAECLRLPLKKVWLPDDLSMERYGSIMKAALADLRVGGISYAAFGDILLEELRSYREEKLQEAGLNALFPLWMNDTAALARECIELGFKARVVCVDGRVLDRSFAGREYDAAFLDELPEGVDPCGEYGEFHTFVYDGPIFDMPIPFEPGEIVYREIKSGNPANDTCGPGPHSKAEGGLWFSDLMPK
ncbi:MAG: diphthine--ammonia ligase [Balneolaceae bacterium]|nr:diphthine--ammonia ligase [Balneolaceae bacterium]